MVAKSVVSSHICSFYHNLSSGMPETKTSCIVYTVRLPNVHKVLDRLSSDQDLDCLPLTQQLLDKLTSN